jgi:hypothetical protein
MGARVPAQSDGSQNQQGKSNCQRNRASHQQAGGCRPDQVGTEACLHLGINSLAAICIHDDYFPAAGG